MPYWSQFLKCLLNEWAKHNPCFKKWSQVHKHLCNKVQNSETWSLEIMRVYYGSFDNVYVEEMTFRW